MRTLHLLLLTFIFIGSFQISHAQSSEVDSAQYKKDFAKLESIEAEIETMSISDLVSSDGNKILFEVLKYSKKVNDEERVARYYYQLAAVHFNNHYLEDALYFYQHSMDWAVKIGDSATLSSVLRGIGLVYARKQIADSAFLFLDSSALYIKDTIPSYQMAKYYERKGNIYESIDEDEKTLECYQKALEYMTETEESVSQYASLYESIGVTYYNLGEFEKAIESSKKALKLARKAKVIYIESSSLNTLAMANKRLEHFEAAYFFLDLFMVIRDSVYNAQTSKSILQNQLDFEAEQKAFADSVMMAENAKVVDAQLLAEKEKSKTQRLFLWFVGILALVIIVGSILIYKRYKVAQEQKDIIDQEKSKLATVNGELRDLHESRSRFFSNIAHEFRTPLSVIAGATDELRKELGETSYLNLIENNNNALLNLVNQILQLRKLEAGELILHYHQIDLKSYLENLMKRLSPLAVQKNIDVSLHVDLTQPTLDADKDVLERVVSNLFSNAVKFTPEGGKIQIKVVEQSGTYQLSIADNGIGMTREDADKVFNRFYQVNQTEDVGVEGTGIGLSLVKNLVELGDGKINVTTEKGKGTEFNITLPLSRKALSENSFEVKTESANVIDSQETTKNEGGKDKPVVLLVEDHADLRQLLTQKLSNDYQVVVAENGRVGYDKAIELVPDLILSDVMMPEMNGFELCNQLRANEAVSHIPFILLTALTDEEHKTSGLKYGADAYLEKPVNDEALKAQLNNAWKLRQNIIARYKKENWQLDTSYERVELEDEFVKRMHQIVLTHLDDSDFGPDQLAKEMNMSRTQIFKKIKGVTGETAANYMRKLRLLEAKKMLQSQTGETVSEIAFKTGFNSVQYFSRQYKTAFGNSPSQEV